MKAIYKMTFDCGRMGELTGIFTADSKDIKNLIGKEVYFGEVLGKHSEVYGTIDKNEIKLVTKEKEAIEVFEKYGLESGYNPFDYISDSEEE